MTAKRTGKATGRKVAKTTTDGRQAVKATKGYKGHNAGSRKEQVHKAYDQKGHEAAMKLGQKLGLKDGTLKSWMGTWRRDAAKADTTEQPDAKAA
ncbi:hypothetical protein HW532_15035 [Kaustia mangrovi]|uniref:Uncharacterized protein n=1 Tax=Kaustia mangrovi TaxID=2593653 RepID=A0A7S8HCM6_9HYPH|nr:hypothetical protein [Kaustia mangrovi]QPC43887.1 hypothetical protein HW532_15035 [Kaustia mangrovi]